MPRCLCCGEKFEKKYPTQIGKLRYCLLKDECLKEFYKAVNERKRRNEQREWNITKKELKEKLKTKKDYEKELERIFNKYIRLRDRNEPCISCGAKAHTYKLTAGHYFPAGSYKNIRFDEDNVHSQCWYNCNRSKSGNLIEYRVGLVGKIGTQRLEALEKRAREPRKYTIPELIELKKYYKNKIKELTKN